MTASPGNSDDAPDLSASLTRNIQALHERRTRDRAASSPQERLADAITRFAANMAFVYLHVAAFSGWILVNTGAIPGVRPFDPSFVVLGMVASVEALFLSTFVLISQRRNAAIAEKRADLGLHIGLLTEHEITKLAGLVADIAGRVGVPPSNDPEIHDMQRHVPPEAVLDEIEQRSREE